MLSDADIHYLDLQKRLEQFFKTHAVTEDPILCHICRRICRTAREATYALHTSGRILQAWCSSECFNADPDEERW